MKETKEIIRQMLQNLEELFGKYFEIQDWQGFRIIFAVACAHYLPGEMQWFRTVGGSGSGRTELLRALLASPDTAKMETFTPAAIRGGLPGSVKLLKRIHKKLVITKDFAALSTMRNDLRKEIFGLIRNVKDGSLTSDFGTREGHIYQKIYFNWIIATTPVYESQRQFEGMLGERFIDMRWIPGDRIKMAIKAGRNNPNLRRIRRKLRIVVKSLMELAKELADEAPPKITNEELEQIAEWADVVTRCRSPVHINSYTKTLESMPMLEVATRLTQDLTRILRGLKVLGIKAWQPYIIRLAWDNIPSVRAELLKHLHRKPRSAKALSNKTKIASKTVYQILSQLELLGIVKKVPVKGNLNGMDKAHRIYKLRVALPPLRNID